MDDFEIKQGKSSNTFTYFLIIYILITVILYIVGFTVKSKGALTAAYIFTAVPLMIIFLLFLMFISSSLGGTL